MYDVAHNIAKKEIHTVDGKKQELIVHRKGATRAYPQKHPEICKAYKAFGHPACIPGSMGTHSFIVRGTQKALDLTWGSVAHGSGRVMSRHRAMQEIRPDVVLASLEKKGILLKSPHVSKIMDEAPQVYKDSYEVIEALTSSGIAEPIISLRPLGVIKA
jgi:tRNA-splicing ligase RtcB